MDRILYGHPGAEHWMVAYELRAAAIARLRELHEAGAPTVPTALTVEPPFGLCQNDVELQELYELSIEDATSANRRFVDQMVEYAEQRRAGLIAAGIVRGPAPF